VFVCVCVCERVCVCLCGCVVCLGVHACDTGKKRANAETAETKNTSANTSANKSGVLQYVAVCTAYVLQCVFCIGKRYEITK